MASKPDLTTAEGVLEWAEKLRREWDGDYGTIDCGFADDDTETAAYLAKCVRIARIVERTHECKHDWADGIVPTCFKCKCSDNDIEYASDILAEADASEGSEK